MKEEKESSRILDLNIQKIPIKIKTDKSVFVPSPHGSNALGNVIKIHKGEKVIDIGCGTGFLSIFAAKKGGVVCGTDILPKAVELSKENASKNNVNVDFKVGDLFSPFNNKKFDVIIANVPQELLSPKIVGKWSKDKVVSYSGGKTGSELLIRTLKEAKNHMHDKTRFYVVVYTMTDYRKSLKFISDNFSARLVNFYSGPVKDFLYEDLEWYKQNKDISIYPVENKYFADLFVFELNLKK